MGALQTIKRRLVRVVVRAGEAGLQTIGVQPPAALLLLGHMRSGSTLLLHLVLTNPEVAGVGEDSATLATKADLARMAIATRISRRLPFAQLRYVAAQINHSKFTPNPALFDDPRVRLLFLIRQPAASLSSLLELTRTYYEAWSIERAVDYYVERLGTMAGYARGLAHPQRSAFLDYEDLIDRPAPMLARLQSFLGTTSGFSERYQTHDFTGSRGDPGPNIGSGRIVRPQSTPRADLPPQELERAKRAYVQCREALSPLALCPGA